MEDINNIEEEKKINEQTVEQSEQEVEVLDEDKEVSELRAKVDEFKDKYQRTFAEFDNFRKRTTKEKEEMYDIGVMETVEKIIPMIDNFERALQQLNTEETSDSKIDGISKGISMIYTQFMDTLNNIGITVIDCQGKEFDPNLHNAVMHTEDEGLGENLVAEVFQKGYMYNNKVIRHSMVRVVN